MINFIVELKQYYFHILPNVEISQELNTKILQVGIPLNIKTLYQKDGSKLKTIYSKYFSSSDVVRRLEEIFTDRSFIPETKTTKEHLLTLLSNPEHLIYRAYKMHQFLNGTRYLPIIIDQKSKSLYNASILFEQLIPDDDIGVLVENIEELRINILPQVINYEAHIRLCPCCGIVSNVSTPRKNPWMFKKHF